jgi:DNA-binding HxlR family transcriptional regulator
MYLTYQKECSIHNQCFVAKNKMLECAAVTTCSVDYAFRRIGGKYKGRILWYLHEHTILRYGELNRTLPDITTKMLTQTLRELETDNLIHREVYHEVPPKVEYTLTEIGKELIPFINYLKEWGDKQMKREKRRKTIK